MIDQISEVQRDLLREISNIGSGHAATALSQLLDSGSAQRSTSPDAADLRRS